MLVDVLDGHETGPVRGDAGEEAAEPTLDDAFSYSANLQLSLQYVPSV